MTTQSRPRTLTGAKVASMLSKAIIPALGTNKLAIAGQGNPYIRENGTAIHIFNLVAFPTTEAAQAAATAWKEGLKLEKSGDIEGAQLKFREALNHQMSFSVLAENASDFQQAYEINCRVELVKNQAGEDVVGINNPRPVAIVAAGNSASAMFTMEEETKPAKAVKTPKAKKAA